VTEAQRERAGEALRGIDGAAITTIHGFARRILAEHPFAAGLPPVIEVLDEIRSQVDFEERWVQFIDRLSERPGSARPLTLALTCGVTVAHLREVAKQFNESWDRVPPPESQAVTVPVPDPARVLEPLRRALALAHHCTAPDDRLLAHLEDRVRPLVERLAHADGELDVLETLVGATGLRCKHGRGPAWAERKPEVVALLEEAAGARDDMVRATLVGALTQLGDDIAGLTIESAEARRRAGRLHFHDLLVLARDLVRTSAAARTALHHTYRYLLIDEFQDTDPIQAELAVRLVSGDPDPAGKPWPDLAVDPGRIFFVGDPKQSIYRFRGADIALFLQTRETFGPAQQLTTNFRSAPGIVRWVNETFDQLIGAGQPSGQPAYEPLIADPDGNRSGWPEARRVVTVGAEAESGVKIDEVRRREAGDLARAIARVRDEGWPVGPEHRPARLADVTVLIPTRSVLAGLAEALDDSSIPYRLESSSLVYASNEVRDLLSIVQAVDDPTDQAAVVAALRSPGFGCGDDDLLRFHRAGGSWDYLRSPPPELAPDHPVVAGQAALAELHGGRWWQDVSGLIEEILVTRRLLPLALGGVRWREAWRRLRFVADQARQFTEGTAGSLRQYLAWVDLQRAEDAQVKEVVLPESDLEAVRIMTVHASKGLEFPVVVLAGLGGGTPRPGVGVDVLFGAQGSGDRPQVKISAGRQTDGYQDLALQERELAALEQLRLLYVAATRPADFLVVSLHRKAETAPSMARLLAEAGAGRDDLWTPLDEVPPTVPDAERADVGPTPTEPEPPDSVVVRDEWIDARRRQALADAVPATVSATGVARLAQVGPAGAAAWEDAELQAEAEVEAPDGERPAWRKGRAGTAVGRAVHAVLQSVDLATGEGVADLARIQAVAEGVPQRIGDIEAMVGAALSSAEIRRAVAGRYWRELYVGAPVGDRVLEGFVDLLIDGPEGLEVVDYKTDQARSEEELDAAMGRYRLQGAAYALAVEAATGRPVSRCTFLFLRTGGAVDRAIGDLEEAKDQVRRLTSSADQAVSQTI
jgi:ATP-dependent helicase/nuclease subunit A